MNPRRVVFILRVRGTTDRDAQGWAEGVARYLQSMLNEETGDLPANITVTVDDADEGVL